MRVPAPPVLHRLVLVLLIASLILSAARGYREWLFIESTQGDFDRFIDHFRGQTWLWLGYVAALASAMGVLTLGLYQAMARPWSGRPVPLSVVFMLVGVALFLPSIGVQLIGLTLYDPSGLSLEEARFFLRLQIASSVMAQLAVPVFLLGLSMSAFSRAAVPAPTRPEIVAPPFGSIPSRPDQPPPL